MQKVPNLIKQHELYGEMTKKLTYITRFGCVVPNQIKATLKYLCLTFFYLNENLVLVFSIDLSSSLSVRQLAALALSTKGLLRADVLLFQRCYLD